MRMTSSPKAVAARRSPIGCLEPPVTFSTKHNILCATSAALLAVDALIRLITELGSELLPFDVHLLPRIADKLLGHHERLIVANPLVKTALQKVFEVIRVAGIEVDLVVAAGESNLAEKSTNLLQLLAAPWQALHFLHG